VIIRNFYDDKLAQASYLVGCAATGEAIVIDPLRDIQQYLDMAEAQNLRITAVTETHIHADYLSPYPRRLPVRKPRTRRRHRCSVVSER